MLVCSGGWDALVPAARGAGAQHFPVPPTCHSPHPPCLDSIIQDLESRKRAPLYQKKQEDELKAAQDKAAEAEIRAGEAELRHKEAKVGGGWMD